VGGVARRSDRGANAIAKQAAGVVVRVEERID
jgi:hypothetical protein